jgi:vacuolar-type H+-ATPase subunit I/STV1
MADDKSTKELLDQLRKVQKEMKDAREETAGWGESLAEAGKKFIDSINPAVSTQKKINNLEKESLVFIETRNIP